MASVGSPAQAAARNARARAPATAGWALEQASMLALEATEVPLR
jgi:hypothetical protein